MLDGVVVWLVMPIFLLGAIFIGVYNALCIVFLFREKQIKVDSFGNFCEKFRYPLSIITIIFIYLIFR